MDQQPPRYWDQIVHNLGTWLGMNLTVLDGFILLPLLPLFPVLLGCLFFSWDLSWEFWLWKNIPKWVSGPYLLYCAFGFWHFHAPSWSVLLVALTGAAICALALHDGRKRRSQAEP